MLNKEGEMLPGVVCCLSMKVLAPLERIGERKCCTEKPDRRSNLPRKRLQYSREKGLH